MAASFAILDNPLSNDGRGRSGVRWSSTDDWCDRVRHGAAPGAEDRCAVSWLSMACLTSLMAVRMRLP